MNFIAILIAILILLIMITVHEFGHYVAGKIFKFKINEFAIGMGPAIYKKTRKNGEIFSVRALPLGGFCAFEGEDENNDNPNAFNNKKPWQRIIVLIAGAFMNFLLALLVIIIMFSAYGKNVYKVDEITSTGTTMCLQSGDKILEVDGTKMFLATDMVEALDGKSANQEVKFKIYRDGKEQTVIVQLLKDVDAKNASDMGAVCSALGVETYAKISSESFPSGEYLLYFATDNLGDLTSEQVIASCKRISSPSELIEALSTYNSLEFAYFYTFDLNGENPEQVRISLPQNWDTAKGEGADKMLDSLSFSATFYYRLSATSYKASFFERLGESFVYSFKIGGTIFQTLGQLFTGKLGIDTLGGPITTITTTSKIVTYGFEYVLEIMAFIGVNLAVFNLLPIPALDGSRVIFTLIEWIFRKPVPKKVEGIIHAVGLIVLLGFSILVDVLQLT